jgi:dTDP-4-dehydrorhamnose reductase
MPLLLYGTESCPVTKADVQSLDFTVMRFLMKIFKSSNRDLIINCIGFLNFSLPNDLIERRQANFSVKFDKLPNSIHRLY